MSQGCDPSRIEDLYHRYGTAGGQRQQLDFEVTAEEISAAFEATATAVRGVRGSGPFHPSGTRRSLFDLDKERGPLLNSLQDTEHLQALLWSPPRWSVEDRSDLDFMFVAREITPGSAVAGDKRTWVIEKDCQVSADLLLMNTSDRAPIVAEFKRGGDQNAEYALVQALAAAAQLTPARQRARLRTEYSDHFGDDVPERLDVYVIVANPPPRGTRPKLFDRALTHAAELTRSGRLDQWIRRIVFLEAKQKGRSLTFGVLDKPSG